MAHKQPGQIINGPPKNTVDTNVRRLSIASEPRPSLYFMSSAMDIRTNTGRTPSVLDRYTSYSQMQPNHDLLSPRFFAGTPAPNEYNLKSYLGKHVGTSMKGNRRRNFDRAKSDCAFLLPELIDRYPAPNTYNTNRSIVCADHAVSFKGKKGGRPFQTNKGQIYIRPQFNEKDKMSETYDTTSYMGKSSGVSFKGNRRRRIVMEAKNANAGFLLPNLIESTPGPGSYDIKSTIGNSNGVSFKGRKTGPFQSKKGATHITPEFNEKEIRPGHYNLASSMGSSTSVSFKGNRQRTFENARQSNAMFLLPNTANDTPAPGFYSMKSAIGNSEQSFSFKGRKSGPFQSNKGPTYIPIEINERDQRPAPNEYDVSPRRSSRNSGVSLKGDRRRNIDDGRETNAMFLVDKMTNETPGPGSYEVKSITPMDMNGGKFTGRRYGPFQTTSGPIHISPEFDNKSKRPSPASYNVAKTLGKDAPSASFKGNRPNSLFGEHVRPGSNEHTLTTTNMKKDPAYSVGQRTKPAYPEPLNYMSKGEGNMPGQGNYHISRNVVENELSSYSMKRQLRSREIEV